MWCADGRNGTTVSSQTLTVTASSNRTQTVSATVCGVYNATRNALLGLNQTTCTPVSNAVCDVQYYGANCTAAFAAAGKLGGNTTLVVTASRIGQFSVALPIPQDNGQFAVTFVCSDPTNEYLQTRSDVSLAGKTGAFPVSTIIWMTRAVTPTRTHSSTPHLPPYRLCAVRSPAASLLCDVMCFDVM